MQYYQGSVEYFPTKSPYKDNPLLYIFFFKYYHQFIVFVINNIYINISKTKQVSKIIPVRKSSNLMIF